MPEQRRRRDARHAKNAVANGLAERRPITAEEARAMFWAIDRNEFNLFGIRRLAELEVDGLHDAPRGVVWTRRITLMDYAAWRCRDGHILSLLNAGSDVSQGLLPAAVRSTMPKQYATWLARAASRMRQAGFMAAAESSEVIACVCGEQAILRFAPCRHSCCTGCVWKPLSSAGPEDCRPALLCPVCSVEYSDPIVNSSGKKFTGKVLPHFEGEGWTCGVCCYTNKANRRHCRNCGLEPPSKSEDGTQLGSELVHAVTDAQNRHDGKAKDVRWKCTAGLETWALACLPACILNIQKRRDRRQRFDESRGKWQLLLDDEEHKTQKTQKPKFRAMGADECAREGLGITKGQRSARLIRAVLRDDVPRVSAILEAGADLSVENEYGQNVVFLASWGGHACVLAALAHWGADLDKASNGGLAPYEAAALCGHEVVIKALTEAGSRCALESRGLKLPLAMTPAEETLSLQWLRVSTPIESGTACYVDGAFSNEILRRLEALWRSLPVVTQDAETARGGGFSKTMVDRSRQDAAPRRSYFCDVEGWVCRALTEALAVATARGGVSPPCRHAYAHMRYLHYAQPGGFLAAHTDLSRTETATGLKSTHTFILYLSDAEPGSGGETILLEHLDQTSPATARVVPVRGRLLVFPHLCPHRAEPVEAAGKLLLRGEMR